VRTRGARTEPWLEERVGCGVQRRADPVGVRHVDRRLGLDLGQRRLQLARLEGRQVCTDSNRQGGRPPSGSFSGGQTQRGVEVAGHPVRHSGAAELSEPVSERSVIGDSQHGVHGCRLRAGRDRVQRKGRGELSTSVVEHPDQAGLAHDGRLHGHQDDVHRR
jgi:hypothetical protein